MLRFITAIFLMLAFTVQTFGQAFIVVDYYLNHLGYAKNCENKKQPALHCNGKCQMLKKMKAEEKNDGQSGERKSELKSEVLSSKSYFNAGCNAPNFFKTPYRLATSAAHAVDRSYAVFHPPAGNRFFK